MDMTKFNNREMTVVQFAIEGLVDDDHPPRVFHGYLDKEQCTKLAREYGCEYPAMALVECAKGERAVFYANYSNEENPPLNADWTIDADYKGHLEVWFYHTVSRDQGIEF